MYIQIENQEFSDRIVEKALALGFEACGITKAEPLKEAAEFVEKWLEKGFSATMHYMHRNKEKRYNPVLLAENTQSIVSVLFNYFPKERLTEINNYKIAKYAYGTDYHFVVKKRLNVLLQFVEQHTGKLPEARVFCDSAPVLDRALAAKCGLGFIGRNTSLINPKTGSFCFIAHLFLPVVLTQKGEKMKNRCGNCTACVDACPTRALEKPFSLDARKCISYLTIEHKGTFENRDKKNFDNWIFGCDICQDVCPWNRFAKPNNEPLFQPSEALLAMQKSDWEQLDKQMFKQLFKNSAVQRTGFEGLKHTIDFLSEND
ncbi:MAG: tRNA epoxyqueuosine(34) reductase QueG [Lentimicrobiaceae bacterium]|jgi:epoxyqueuosine reductase|nr:tRNA epoxyqueuosine(34) reductase QueG [Lentimicrobiaceae bacterium]